MFNRDNLFNLLSDGNISEVKKLIKSIDMDQLNEEIKDTLMEVSIVKQSIVPYAVILNMLIEDEKADLHAFASILLSNALCWLEGAYHTGYYHQKRAIDLEPQNIIFKEYMLIYNSLPDEILSDEDALKLRKEILKEEPENETVKQHFNAKRFIGLLD